MSYKGKYMSYLKCILAYSPPTSSLEGVEEDLEKMRREKYWKRFLKKDDIQSSLLKRENEIRASYDAMMVRDQTRRPIGF